MNARQYAEYQETVARYLKGCEAVSTGPCPGCEECNIPCVCGHGFVSHDHGLDCDHALDDGEHEEGEPLCECRKYQAIENYNEGYEPWFSWTHCEICKTTLGGDREAWHCIIEGKIVHGSCCEDCVYYINYGTLDDTQMHDIEIEKIALVTRLLKACDKPDLPVLVACDWLEERGLGDQDDIDAARIIFKETPCEST